MHRQVVGACPNPVEFAAYVTGDDLNLLIARLGN